LVLHQADIASGKLKVLFLDECHLVWGDISGYGWSRRNQRIDVPVKSIRQRQTYYGALDYLTKSFTIHEYERGNEDYTIAFLQHLQSLYPPDTRLLILWDGASYHRSAKVKAFLGQVNGGLTQAQWKITCIRLAPNAPEQNPVEDVWLQGKRFIRKYAVLCKTFSAVKLLFKLATHLQTFVFAKAFMYGFCSCPI
jgi:transposase